MKHEVPVVELVDRAGRTWKFSNYTSPTGPAFCITLPDDLIEWAGNYTVHFDGTLNIEEAEGGVK
jgi:hypothetical protein